MCLMKLVQKCRKRWSGLELASSTRTAAGRASASVSLSGQDNPNKEQSLEIALEREEISFIAKPEGRIGGAAGEEAAARLVLILRNEAKIRY
jgi:hypothetical protein